ncbi:MAG: hypothetical protein ACK5QX_00660, partial [bacterium]
SSPPIHRIDMDTVSNYFSAERTESLVFITVGLLALLASAACVIVLRKPLFNGMALTLTVVAVLQLIVGITIYQRSPQDTARVQQMLQSAPKRIQSEEVPRMQVVMRNFRIYLGVEVVLLILALLVIPFAAPGGFLRGAAIGLALQAVFTAVLDLVATRRGEAYLNWLLSQP